ncbi:alpha-amylase [Spirochaetia bacterium]|nr:alpha-amylase [Spirochaetia bacterium]
MDDFKGQFKGLPMEELIGAPLTAVCESQKKLAVAQYEFITNLAFEDGKEGGKTRMINFDLTRPVETPTGIDTVKTPVQAPFIGLVPIPSLLIEDVNIDFQMEVSAAEASKEKTAGEISTSMEASGGLFVWKAKVSVQGKVSSSKENTRSTNQTAKYQVHVKARQQPQTEGLSRLMDIMAQCVGPIKPDNKESGASSGDGADA